MKKKFYYETKCRRCGKITCWYAGNTEDGVMTEDRFVSYITEKAQYLTVCTCEKCGKRTFQEVVSYEIVEVV